MTDESGILKGVRVLDVGQMLAGPMIASLLADFGADVLKIEEPTIGDSLRRASRNVGSVPLWWTVASRNKRSVALDLRDEAGREILLQLVGSSNVLIENFRPGTLEKLDLGPEVLWSVRPDLIIVRVSGYGQEGPYADRPGFGKAVEAITGVVALTGEPTGPPMHTGFPMSDVATAVMGAYATVLALYGQAQEGEGVQNRGEIIDLAIYDTPLRMIDNVVVEYGSLGLVPSRAGNGQPSVIAFSNAYQAKDSKWVSVNGGTFPIFQRISEVVGMEDLLVSLQVTSMEDVVRYRDQFDERIREWVSSRDAADVVDQMSSSGAVAVRINTIADAFVDPHIQFRGNISRLHDEEAGDLACPAVVPRLARRPGRIRSRGPRLGEHTQEVLIEELGLSVDRIRELEDKGVLKLHEHIALDASDVRW